VLDRTQELLESIYHLDLGLCVDDFYIGSEKLQELGGSATPREQLLVLEEEGEASLALFIDDEVMARLRGSERITLENLGDYCLLAEGVSHFVYFIWKARRREPVTQLEMELQAEVDKYLTCRVQLDGEGRTSADLAEQLFRKVAFRADLDGDEADRYRTANRLALAYCAHLERSYLRDGGLRRAMPELRHFYRLTQPRKLAHIAARQ
jgi:hypothetical protein